LIGAIPRVGQGKKKMKKSLTGEVPSPINPPSGCAFHPRCPYVMDVCSKQTPQLEGQGEHKKACFLP
jgi:oligopeptide transport system ATP-binding protein